MGFSRQEYWNGLLCPPPGDLPDPGIEPASPAAPALQAGSLYHGATVFTAGLFRALKSMLFCAATQREREGTASLSGDGLCEPFVAPRLGDKVFSFPGGIC